MVGLNPVIRYFLIFPPSSSHKYFPYWSVNKSFNLLFKFAFPTSDLVKKKKKKIEKINHETCYNFFYNALGEINFSLLYKSYPTIKNIYKYPKIYRHYSPLSYTDWNGNTSQASKILSPTFHYCCFEKAHFDLDKKYSIQ